MDSVLINFFRHYIRSMVSNFNQFVSNSNFEFDFPTRPEVTAVVSEVTSQKPVRPSEEKSMDFSLIGGQNGDFSD